MKFIGGLFIFVALAVSSTIVHAYSMYYLWLWFIVPFGITQISMNHCAGLQLIIRYNVYQLYLGKNEESNTILFRGLAYLYAIPLFCLFSGLIIHLLGV